MGDRGNIKTVSQENQGGIYFYTHWTGSDLPETLRQALIRGRGRWDDEPCLNRIIFSQMIKDGVLDETGFGISADICDNEHPIITVDCSAQTVSFERGQTWSFEEYIKEPRSFYSEEEEN